MTKKIKTIDVNAKQWFDRINGNSYFAAIVTVNFGMDDQRSYKLPFQYGYGEYYIDMARQELEKQGEILVEHYSNGSSQALWSYCRNNGIILRTNKETGCKKRELKAI